MKKRETIFLILFVSGIYCFAQNPICSNGYVYMDGGGFISYFDPSLPLSSTNPSLTNIPTFGSGLALMPNINSGTLSPTFYTTSGGTYWYWDGTAWINTGHSTGSNSAVNIAGCGSTLYNIVGSTGQIYVYNGSANGSLLTTLSGFNGGGPYDLVTDCNCNFYALNTSTPNQGLSMYSSGGALQCTYTLSGMPNTSAGGGFAIIGNMIYVKNNNTPNFFIGTISGGGVTFTAVTGFNSNPGDFASCSVCYPATSLAGSTISSATLGCTSSTVGIAVTTTASPVTYLWSGPGIVGPANNSFVVVNTPGNYSCVLTTGNCPPTQLTLNTTVLSNTVPVLAQLTPSGSVCVKGNDTTKIFVAHFFSSDVVTWSGPGMPVTSGTDSIQVQLPGVYTVSVLDVVSGCTATNTLSIHQTPTVNLAMSNNTLCLQNYNGSPATITLTPSGAYSYTLLTSTNYSTTSPNGTLMPCFPVTISGNFSQLATATLVGSNGVCEDTTTTFFSIIPNPLLVLSETSASICPGGSKSISVSGAAQYLWGGSNGLNTNAGSNVIITPNASSVYSVTGGNVGCKSLTQTLSIIILPTPLVSITPATSTVCLGTPVVLSTLGTATSFVWAPAMGLLSSPNAPFISVSPPTTMVYSVTGYLNSCTNIATATVNIVQPPVLSLSLSSSTICSQNFNNSPSIIQFVPAGATNYTFLTNNNLTVSWPNGPVMYASVTGSANFGPSVMTASLIGQTGVCTVVKTETFMVLPNPVLSMSPPSASACPGEVHTFNVSGATNYAWYPMPGYTVTGSNHSSIVTNASLTSFYSVVGESNGCRSADKNAVLVVLPVPEVSVSPVTTTVCAGNSVTLSAVGNASTYIWSPSAHLSTGFGTLVTATPKTLQNYTVTATLNTCTNQAVAMVSVIVMPVLNATSMQPTICSSGNTKLKVTGANSFVWFPNESLNYPGGSEVIASPNESTTYTVHGYNGICTGSTSIFIKTVNRPDMDLIVSDNQVCSGSAIPIGVKGAQSFTWLPAGSFISTGTNTSIIATPSVSTLYTVIAETFLGPVSCYQQLTYQVGVVPEIIPTISDNVSICIGDKVTLYAGGSNSFKWSPAYGLNLTNGAGVVANPKVTTVYTVEVSYDSYCGKTTTVMVTVNPKPEVFAGNDTTYNLNDAIFIRATGTGTLNWVRGEDIVCAACQLTQVYPSRNGCYSVEAENDFGCKATDEICLELTKDFSIYIPNTFTPNDDGKNDHFLIFGENISEISMEIYDRWGVKVFHSDDYSVGWDGKNKDVLCPLGVYTYVIKYTGLNRKKYTRTGNVNIVR